MSWADAGGDAAKLALLSQMGRIQPITKGKNRCLAAIHPHLPHIGAIGDWVGTDSVRLRAERWLQEQGCSVARGPMELCTWFSYRVNTGPHEQAPFLMEPVEPPERWMAAGYTPCAEYTSTLMPHGPIIAASKDTEARLLSEGWSLQSLPRGPDGTVPEQDFSNAVDTIHHIAHRAFAPAFGFAPLPLAILHQMYGSLRRVLDPDLVLFAIDPTGEPGGFVFGLPDLAAPERNWAIIKTSAILPNHAGKRLGTWLNAAVQERMQQRGYTSAVYALMWQGSASQHWSRYGGSPLRTYKLLEKDLTTLCDR